MNRVMLLGNLGADPELRFTQSGQAILHLRLATTESFLDKDKVRRERTDWHSVVVWGKRGEALGKILTKGSSVFVEGRIQTSSYDDREGVKRYKTEIVANNIVLGGKRSDSAPTDAGEPQQRAPQGNGSRPQYNRQAPQQQRQAPRSGGNGAGSTRAPADPQEPAESDGGGFGGDDDSLPF
jgi:single-strand DNA-binding protein